MRLLKHYFLKERTELRERGVEVTVPGDVVRLPFFEAIEHYQKRERRFARVTAVRA